MAGSCFCGAERAVSTIAIPVLIFEMICDRLNRAARSRALLTAAIVGFLPAFAAPACAREPASANHLTTGSVLAPSLAPPGWIAEHLASWINDHPAYAATCRTDEVADQLQYLERLVDRDQDLRDTARAQLLHAVVEGNSTAKRHTDVAIDALTPLDNDISAIDRLLVRLTGLPACAPAAAPPVTAAAPPAPAPAPPPEKAAAVPVPPAEPAKPSTPAIDTATPTAPAPAAKQNIAAPRPRGDNLFVVRFDSKLPALSPSGIRTLEAALAAADAGRKVRIAIEGCENRDSAPEGADCAERTRELTRILADRDVKHPDQLIAKQR